MPQHPQKKKDTRTSSAAGTDAGLQQLEYGDFAMYEETFGGFSIGSGLDVRGMMEFGDGQSSQQHQDADGGDYHHSRICSKEMRMKDLSSNRDVVHLSLN